MTEKRFIRTIAGEIYDSENDSFIHQDYVGKPIEYEDECIKLLNEQDQKIKDVEQELFAEKVKRLDERLAEYGGPDDEKVWQEEFGMSQREAKKKAGWSDWCYYPE